MSSPSCTFVIVPREKFSVAEASYESFCKHTPSEYPVIYVDSCSPQPWAQRLDALAAEGKITLIRAGFHLSQHEAYNLALPHVRTKYVIFLDNDVCLTPGWCEKLIACAEETGASVVMPLIEQKEFEGDWHIHMCGGDCGVREKDGEFWFYEDHPGYGEVASGLTRTQTAMMEYHAFLARVDALQKVGPFDENYWPSMDHTDFSLMVLASGGTLWVEPESVVRYNVPTSLKLQDYAFFMTRWSDELALSGVQHFAKKWNVRVPRRRALWYRHFRRRSLHSIRSAVALRFGSIASKMVYRLLWIPEALLSRLMLALTRVPDRRERLEALGSWRGPELDPALVQAYAEKKFGRPRPESMEVLTPVAAD